MPYVEPSWRRWPQLKWLSRLLCFFGRHHWLMSKHLHANLMCVICNKKTPHLAEYEKLRR